MSSGCDPRAEVAYLRFLKGEFRCTTIRLSADVTINIAPGGKVVGIEVVEAGVGFGIRRVEPAIPSH